jgi:hypothetical protein
MKTAECDLGPYRRLADAEWLRRPPPRGEAAGKARNRSEASRCTSAALYWMSIRTSWLELAFHQRATV